MSSSSSHTAVLVSQIYTPFISVRSEISSTEHCSYSSLLPTTSAKSQPTSPNTPGSFSTSPLYPNFHIIGRLLHLNLLNSVLFFL